MSVSSQRNQIAVIAVILALGLGGCTAPATTSGASVGPVGDRGTGVLVTPGAAPNRSAQISPTAWSTPNAPLQTSTGTATQVEILPNNQAHVRLMPEDPAMKSDFVIGDWGKVTVLFYWAGLQTPTPVAEKDKLGIIKAALGRTVSIGYYTTDPPMVVTFFSHKKPGDPQ